MRRIPVDPADPSPSAIAEAADVLRRGGLVAFPTETVYGLGANALDPQAVSRIFAAKGRPADNPLIVHVVTAEDARGLVVEWPESAERLARAFWPGPLTLVLKRRALVPDIVTAGLSTVALRVPAHPTARALIAAAGVPVAAPSANPSTELSPTTADHVLKGLGGRVDVVLDGGPSPVGIESTVVDATGEDVVLLRPGSIHVAELSEALGRDVIVPHPERAGRGSPGLRHRHYRPRARLVLFPHGDAAAFENLAARAAAEHRRVAALLLGIQPRTSVERVVRMPNDARGYARDLFGTLHALDDEGFEIILVEAVPAGAEWAGVRDRLTRASDSWSD